MNVDSCGAIRVGPPIAQVAELVDAQVSGTCGRMVVEVRVFSWAPTSDWLTTLEGLQQTMSDTLNNSNPIIKLEQEASGNRLLTKALNTICVWSQSHSAINSPRPGRKSE